MMLWLYLNSKPFTFAMKQNVVALLKLFSGWLEVELSGVFCPGEYGAWNSVYRRFAGWADKGIWYKMLYHFANNPDMKYVANAV
ncbi:MAG: hypothetical protein ACTSXG_02710 [Alphaproteobacteria bacterium]